LSEKLFRIRGADDRDTSLTTAGPRAKFCAMRSRCRRLTLVWVLLCASPGVFAQGAPWLGAWQLDPARSARMQPSPYKRVTLTIERAGDGLKVTYDMVGPRGGVMHLEWAGGFDGRDQPVQGADTVLTNAYRRVDDRSYAIEVKVEGVPVANAVAAVSPDGRTLTVTQQERDAAGRSVTSTAVYARQ